MNITILNNLSYHKKYLWCYINLKFISLINVHVTDRVFLSVSYNGERYWTIYSAWKLGNEWYRIKKLKILSLAAFDQKDLHLEIVCLILSERIFIFTDLMISMSVALCIRRSHCVSCGGWRDTHTSGHWTRVSWRPQTSLLYWPPITPLSTCCHGLFCLRNSYHSG